MTLPPNVFFRPTPRFIEWADSLGIPIVDCGAGMGHLSRCLASVLCIDTHMREGMEPCVLPMDATRFDHFGPACAALLARPCHGPWVREVFERALDAGSRVFYAGLPRNYADDLSGCRAVMVMDNAGEDGEELWEIMEINR